MAPRDLQSITLPSNLGFARRCMQPHRYDYTNGNATILLQVNHLEM